MACSFLFVRDLAILRNLNPISIFVVCHNVVVREGVVKGKNEKNKTTTQIPGCGITVLGSLDQLIFAQADVLREVSAAHRFDNTNFLRNSIYTG